MERIFARLKGARVKLQGGSAGRSQQISGVRLIGILVFCVAAVALAGCQNSSGSQAREEAKTLENREPEKKSPPPVEAQIFEDEAMLKGSQAVVGGKVQNVSGSKLVGLAVEIELKQRQGGKTETRTAQVQPQELAPGEEGRYSLTVSREWNSARLLRLRSATRDSDIAYNSARGARRPPERIETKTKVIVVPRPKPKGEEFINTPDNPEHVP